MTKRHDSIFSARAPALGYLYQIRYALLDSLRRLRDCEDFQVGIERLDDVQFEPEGRPIELLQTKHHIRKTASLKDSSQDLWHTIRVWASAISDQQVPEGFLAYLITTAQAPEGSAAFYLRPSPRRNIERALQLLDGVSETSSNPTNKAAYEAYRKLTAKQKLALLGSAIVLDSQPDIDELDLHLKKELSFVVSRPKIGSFLKRLEGFWFERAVRHMINEKNDAIASDELQAEIDSLREQFRRENLPVDPDIMSAFVDASGYRDNTFVKQLKMIGIKDGRIVHAIRNFYRAFEQRSRWVGDELLMVGDLERYDDRLFEEWELHFLRMCDDLPRDALDGEMIEAAKRVFEWAA